MLGEAASFLSHWALPFLLLFIPTYAILRGVRVYEAFVEGADQAFELLRRIFPPLVAMLVAVGVFRASGALELFSAPLRPLLDWLGFPGEVLPLLLVRPFSGSGALGIMAELIKQHGADSPVGRLAAALQGSTETTFYVLAVYFGSVGVKDYRYAPKVGLLADAVAAGAAFFFCRLLF